MASAFLGLVTLTVGQTGKENAVNDMATRIEQATQRELEVDMSAGDTALTETQFTTNGLFVCTGLTAARVLTVPDEIASNGANTAQRIFSVANGSSYNVTVTQGGTDTVTLLPGETTMIKADGTDLRRLDAAISLGGYVPGIPTGSATVFQYVADHPFALATGLPGSQGYLRVAATAMTTYDVQKNGVSIGSMVFGAAGQVATFTFSSDVSFAIGDRLSVVAPASPDATAQDLSFTFAGIRR